MGVTLPTFWILSLGLVACGTAAAPEESRIPSQTARRPALKASPIVAAAATPKPAAPLEPKVELAEPEREAGDDSSFIRELPSTCSGTEGCYPPADFVELTCRGKFPALPLALFAKSAPWQHRFVQAISVDAENTYGGPRSSTNLSFGEEVVVLRRRGPSGARGVQISGPTDLDVLRWDGTCATVREELFVSYNQGQMTSPHIVWKYLDDAIQEALKRNPTIERAQVAERKSCRDSSPNKPTPPCDRAMRKLTDAIIVALRAGLDLPAPQSGPAWRSPEPTASR